MSDDTRRRIALLMARPGLEGRKDEFLEYCVRNAEETFLEYTNRHNDPGEKADMVICELASHYAYYEGVENVSSATDGSMSRSFFEGIPPAICQRMNSWRLIGGLYNATDEP